jgi:hypothetical protein
MNENNINNVVEEVIEEPAVVEEDTATEEVNTETAETAEEPKKMTLSEITKELLGRQQELEQMKIQYAQNLDRFRSWCTLLSIPENEYTSITTVSEEELKALSSEEIREKYPVVSSNITVLEEMDKAESDKKETPAEESNDNPIEVTSERMAELVLEEQAEAAFKEDPVKTTILAINKTAADIKEWSKGIRDLQAQQETDLKVKRYLDKDYRNRIINDEKASPELKAKAKAWLDRTKDIDELGPVFRKAKLLKDTIMTCFHNSEKRRYAYDKFSKKFENSENLLKVFTDVDVCIEKEIRDKHELFANFVLTWYAAFADRIDANDVVTQCEWFASGWLSDEEEKTFIDSINKIVRLLVS